MRIITSVTVMQRQALRWKRQGIRVGLVPTMGYLHEGHLSLVRIARREADLVVLSIFVNPIQFLPGEDLARYPRDFRRDCRLCRASGVDVVFHPTVRGMYAPDRSVLVTEQRLSGGLCGAARPGHFTGVLTVVAKLFNIVLPDVAVFGQKDAQQARIVGRMIRDLNFPVRLIVGPIIREPDGLAMSSRNRYLTPEERRQAPALRQALALAESMYRRGVRSAEAIRQAVARQLAAIPGARTDYVAVVDPDTLTPLHRITHGALVALAVRLGSTRLIDNTLLGRTKWT